MGSPIFFMEKIEAFPFSFFVDFTIMACQAPKAVCTANCVEGNLCCAEHRNQWFRTFILGTNKTRFYYTYDETLKRQILNDLQTKLVVLTKKDIQKIPANPKHIDIYLLLVEYGYIDKSSKPELYKEALVYLLECMGAAAGPPMLSFLGKKICEILITKDAEDLLFFLHHGKLLLSLPKRITPLREFLHWLLSTEAAQALSWIPFRDSLLAEYKDQLGENHLFTVYLEQQFLPAMYALYQSQKQDQKGRFDARKEELMAIAWHPDRFLSWCLDEEEKAENRMLFG